MLIQVTENNFDSLVKNADKPVLVCFTATWCPACQAYFPVVEAIKDKYIGRVFVCTVDVDNNPNLMQKLSLESIPSTLIFSNGKQVYSKAGVMPIADISKQIDTHI